MPDDQRLGHTGMHRGHAEKCADSVRRGGPTDVCGHGFKQELPAYRGVRIFEMNCGEVSTSLSLRDFFQPAYIQEWIDGALLREDLHKWHSLDREALEKAISALQSTEPTPTEPAKQP